MCVTNIAKRQHNPVVVGSGSLTGNDLLLIPLQAGEDASALSTNSFKTAVPTSTDATTINTSGLVPLHNQFSSQPLSMDRSQQSEEKTRPKRKRKPQKPGKTAKLNDRHFVIHNYHDHALDPDENDEEEDEIGRRRGGVSISFPTKLHGILEQVEADGYAHIVSWQPHGRCFVIHKPREFADHIMPNYFRQTKLTSFQRQLNLYGFCRLTRGKDAGGYYHELFLRGRSFLTKRMQRTKVKGTRFKAASSPDQEPDFYLMPAVLSPQPVSDDSSAEGMMSPTVNGGIFPPMLGSTATLTFEPPVLEPPRFPTLTINPNIAQGMDSLPGLPPSFTHLVASQRSIADDILDEVVDELLANDPGVSDSGDFENIWDVADFGEDSFEEDIRLGYTLERLLED